MVLEYHTPALTEHEEELTQPVLPTKLEAPVRPPSLQAGKHDAITQQEISLFIKDFSQQARSSIKQV